MDLQKTTIAEVFQSRIENEKPFATFWVKDAWRQLSWCEYGKTVHRIASGLLEWGVTRGDGVCIMSGTRVEWGMADLAVLSIGAVTGAIYPTLLGADTAFILNDMKAEVVFVEGAAQRDVILSMKPELRMLRRIVVFDGDAGEDPCCMALQALIDTGDAALGQNMDRIRDAIRKLEPTDMATVVYTSGTTGTPKGAVHNHRDIVYTATMETYPLEAGMRDLAYLPMAHVFERFGGFFPHIWRGDMELAYFRGDMQGLLADFQEIRPHVNRTAPRLLEKVYSGVLNMAAAGGEEKKQKFEQGLALARAVRVEEELLGNAPKEKVRQAFSRMMEADPFAMVRQLFGGKMKFFYGGGAAIPREVTEFFFCVGIPVYELYGTTETIGTLTNHPGRVRPGAVGVSFPQEPWTGEKNRVRLAADGEIETRGPGVTTGYLNQPEETAAAFSEDGWFKTGDLAEMDGDGFYTIIGRKKEILITAGGKNIAPLRIENHLKESGLFSQVMVYGEGKKYLTALLTLDPAAISVLAGQTGIDLPEGLSEEEQYRLVAIDARIRAAVKKVIEERNQGLYKQERIVNFLLLGRDLSMEENEITPTMKVRKHIVEAHFKDRLDRLYGDQL